jgi:hypothetical protein
VGEGPGARVFSLLYNPERLCYNNTVPLAPGNSERT